MSRQGEPVRWCRYCGRPTRGGPACPDHEDLLAAEPERVAEQLERMDDEQLFATARRWLRRPRRRQ